MSEKDLSQTGNIDIFNLRSNVDNQTVDISAGVVEYNYYESVLSNTISATVTVVETGNNSESRKKGTLDSLPIRGGERARIKVSDNQGGTLDVPLYVNRARDAIPGTQQDLYILDFASQEYFANTQTRVTKRYEGKISDHISSILGDVLPVSGEVDVDETSLEYNFIGNDRKPFYVCTWLASKSVPAQGVGGAAGFLFFQTRDGFHFKSIDNLFRGSPVKKFNYNNTGDKVRGNDANVLNYSIESDTELHQNLTLGTYNNKSIFFDFLAMNYREVSYSIEQQSGDVEVAGRKGDNYNFVAKEFTRTPSRFMTHILDIGVNPKGTGDAQLDNQKANPGEPNFQVEDTAVQSIMRYNQLFSVKAQITIAGDFSIKAGDLVECSFPELSGADLTNTNDQSGGIYMVAHVCHRITPKSTFTSLGLVRDSYGKR
tara:strand:- start:83 stop:1369 length:1287 start_codon:yes stop_codon:yes gene_type:complete